MLSEEQKIIPISNYFKHAYLLAYAQIFTLEKYSFDGWCSEKDSYPAVYRMLGDNWGEKDVKRKHPLYKKSRVIL